jgi:hypothetical protein
VKRKIEQGGASMVRPMLRHAPTATTTSARRTGRSWDVYYAAVVAAIVIAGIFMCDVATGGPYASATKTQSGMVTARRIEKAPVAAAPVITQIAARPVSF